MGADDLYHKRKARDARTHARTKALRSQYERILIVCEGQKTEPNYLKGLRKELALNPKNVVIDDKKHGLDPKSLVEHALDRYKLDKDFDHIFCVFDKDKHTTYDQALDIIKSKRLKGCQMHAIPSIPCFELWILLHFAYTHRSFETACNDSNCALVVSEIKNRGCIPDYEKSNNVFPLLKGHLDDAIKHAKQLEEFHKTSGTDNPSTKMHELVEYLKKLAAS